MTIENVRGLSGYDMGKFGEGEVLLGRGTRLKIISIDKDNTTLGGKFRRAMIIYNIHARIEG
jgi:hypothetical protein